MALNLEVPLRLVACSFQTQSRYEPQQLQAFRGTNGPSQNLAGEKCYSAVTSEQFVFELAGSCCWLCLIELLLKQIWMDLGILSERFESLTGLFCIPNRIFDVSNNSQYGHDRQSEFFCQSYRTLRKLVWESPAKI